MQIICCKTNIFITSQSFLNPVLCWRSGKVSSASLRALVGREEADAMECEKKQQIFQNTLFMYMFNISNVYHFVINVGRRKVPSCHMEVPPSPVYRIFRSVRWTISKAPWLLSSTFKGKYKPRRCPLTEWEKVSEKFSLSASFEFPLFLFQTLIVLYLQNVIVFYFWI